MVYCHCQNPSLDSHIVGGKFLSWNILGQFFRHIWKNLFAYSQILFAYLWIFKTILESYKFTLLFASQPLSNMSEQLTTISRFLNGSWQHQSINFYPQIFFNLARHFRKLSTIGEQTQKLFSILNWICPLPDPKIVFFLMYVVAFSQNFDFQIYFWKLKTTCNYSHFMFIFPRVSLSYSQMMPINSLMNMSSLL